MDRYWPEFERLAIDRLRREPGGHILQFINWPQLGDPHCWTIQQYNSAATGTVYIGFYGRWLRSSDAEMFNNPVERVRFINRLFRPSIRLHKVDSLPLQRVEELTTRARKLRIVPLATSAGLVLDGYLFELSVADHGAEMRCIWGNKPPEQWNACYDLGNDIVALIRAESAKAGWTPARDDAR